MGVYECATCYALQARVRHWFGCLCFFVMQVNADAKRFVRRVLKKGTLYYAETLDGVIGEPGLGVGCTLAQCQL
jgi:hypothetical protein